MEQNAKSFRELYDEIWEPKRQASEAAKNFIKRCAEVTMKNEMTVRSWLSGKYTPDALAQDALERELGIPADVLFPKKDFQSPPPA